MAMAGAGGREMLMTVVPHAHERAQQPQEHGREHARQLRVHHKVNHERSARWRLEHELREHAALERPRRMQRERCEQRARKLAAQTLRPFLHERPLDADGLCCACGACGAARTHAASAPRASSQRSAAAAAPAFRSYKPRAVSAVQLGPAVMMRGEYVVRGSAARPPVTPPGPIALGTPTADARKQLEQRRQRSVSRAEQLGQLRRAASEERAPGLQTHGPAQDPSLLQVTVQLRLQRWPAPSPQHW